MYHRSTLSLQALVAGLAYLLGLSIVLLIAQAGVLAAPHRQPITDPAPTGVRRVIYPNEWGVGRPAGLTYSARLGQFFVVDKRRLQKEEKATLVAITPHDALHDYKQLTFAIDDAINVAYDDAAGRFLALNQKRGELIQITFDSAGQPQTETVERASIAALGLRHPQGMAVDEVGRRLLLLDSAAQQIVSLDLTTPFPYNSVGIHTISLASLGTQHWRGLALHPANRQLYVAAPEEQMLYAVSQEGALVKSYTLADLALSDPQSFVFAPSADLTDAPDTWHLFMADSYLPDALAAGTEPAALPQRLYLPLAAVQEGSAVVAEESTAAQADKKKYLGNIIEVALDWSATEVTAAADPPIVLTLVRAVNTSAYSPPSPDPSGLVYLPSLNRLMIGDGEVDEMPALFTGANLFESNLSGGLLRIGSTLAYSDEPTGVAFNPVNNHLFIADDDAREIFELTTGADGLFGTNDDGRTAFDTAVFNSLDPEGVTYDTETGALFIVDGINAEVYRVSPGANGRFDGVPASGGDDQVTHFDVQGLGVFDPEGIYYDTVSANLFLVGNNRTRIYEITTAGALVQLYDTSAAGIVKNADITLAPGSNNPVVMNFYIVDRGIDNDVDPTENDGRLYEFSRFANPTPTNTPLPPTPTDTPLPATATDTPLSPTPTNTPGAPTSTPTPSIKAVCLISAQDSYLVQDGANNNFGTEKDLKVKPDANKERRIVLAFNLTSLPVSSTVLNATLRLYEDTKKDNQTIFLHRLTSSWNEMQVSWNNRSSGLAWTTPGGEFAGTPLLTFAPNVEKLYRDLDVTGVTQSWVNGSLPNHGFLLRSTGVNGEVKFKSREESNTSKQPQLCINYQ